MKRYIQAGGQHQEGLFHIQTALKHKVKYDSLPRLSIWSAWCQAMTIHLDYQLAWTEKHLGLSKAHHRCVCGVQRGLTKDRRPAPDVGTIPIDVWAFSLSLLPGHGDESSSTTPSLPHWAETIAQWSLASLVVCLLVTCTIFFLSQLDFLVNKHRSCYIL